MGSLAVLGDIFPSLCLPSFIHMSHLPLHARGLEMTLCPPSIPLHAASHRTGKTFQELLPPLPSLQPFPLGIPGIDQWPLPTGFRAQSS